MTSTTGPATFAERKNENKNKNNTHARSTVAILATVRMIGLIVFGLIMVGTALGTLVGTFTSDQGFLLFISGVAMLALQAIFAALWYAGISWLTETLNMLTQIAKNTAI